MPRKKTVIDMCPRCGLPISYYKVREVNGRRYVYAVHYLGYEKVGGKVRKKTKECYLGPEGTYEYATTTHINEGLVLYGATNKERLLDYLERIVEHLENAELEPRLEAKLDSLIKRLMDRKIKKTLKRVT